MQSLPSQSEKLSENDIRYVDKSMGACKKKNPYIINEIHIFFGKNYCEAFSGYLNKFYTKTFGIVYILIVYLLIMFI